MTPEQWARVLRVGADVAERRHGNVWPPPLSAVLAAMAREADRIAEETR